MTVALSAAAPELSVVMPVHNAAAYLAESIESILHQTAADFEFVILDDASTDGSLGIIRQWHARDARIRVIEGTSQLGLAGSADRVVREARAPICARMDADDRSHPERLKAQLAVLREHPDVSLVGTLWEGIDARGRGVRPRDRWRLLRASVFAPFPHGSVMFRRDWFLSVGGYRAPCTYWEDLDFYLRMAELGPIMVIADAMYQYRFHALASTASPADTHLAAVNLMYRCVDKASTGDDYSHLLEGAPLEGGEMSDPRALRAWGAPRLWAGEKTAMLRRLKGLRCAIVDPAFIQAAVFAVWGEFSPRSLRLLLREFIRVRDALTSFKIADHAIVPWIRTRSD